MFGCVFSLVQAALTHDLNEMGISGTSEDQSHSVIFSCLSVTFYCGSVAQSWQTHWEPMDYSTPHLPVLHYFPKFASAHVRWVHDVIQPSHPLSPPSPSALHLSQHQERLPLWSAAFTSWSDCFQQSAWGWVSFTIGTGSCGQCSLWDWAAEDVRDAPYLAAEVWGVQSNRCSRKRSERGKHCPFVYLSPWGQKHRSRLRATWNSTHGKIQL